MVVLCMLFADVRRVYLHPHSRWPHAHADLFTIRFRPWLMPTVLAMFWAAGFGAARYLMGIPCVEARVDASGSVHILRRYPFRKESQTIHAADLAGAELVETKDSEGDLYYFIRFTTADGMQIDVAQSPDRTICETALNSFKAALAASFDR